MRLGELVSDARLAVHLGGGRLEEETFGGRVHWLTRSAAPSPAPRSGAYLLPAFDEFVVGYTDRSAALEPAHRILVNAGGGILNPTIVVDGRIVGTWKRQFALGEVVFSPAYFAALSKPKTQAVARALRRYAEFLGMGARAESHFQSIR